MAENDDSISLKPGDLVKIKGTVVGGKTIYNEDDVGIVLGLAEDDENRSKGCFSILIHGDREDFSQMWLKVISE